MLKQYYQAVFGMILNGKKAKKSMIPDTVMYMIMLQDFVIDRNDLSSELIESNHLPLFKSKLQTIINSIHD